MSEHLMNTYARLPVRFVRGEGAWLHDSEGRKYLDALGGIAVCALGHAHPAIREALCDQAGTLMHTSNLYEIPVQAELADRLTADLGMERAFFCNSGAEANEAAIKIARLYGHRRGIDLPTVVVMEGAFHGRTLATLTATGSRRVQAGFEPLVQGFVRAPYNDLEALRVIAENSPSVVAVLVEPVLGEGGIVIPDDDYLEGVRALCDEQGWLMMLDEIQTGMGRTGRLCAFQHTPVRPDVVTLAKALGNGVPIGACLARGEAAETFAPGNHGSPFGGNPLACRAALAVMETLEKDNLPGRAAELGRRILHGLRDRLEGVEGVKEVRGAGMMLGIELDRPCGELVRMALQEGLLINVTAERVVRLLPPYILTDDEAEQLVQGVSDLVKDFLAQERAA